MQINLDDIVFAVEYTLHSLLNLEKQKEIQKLSKQGSLSEEKLKNVIEKHSVDTVFCNKEADYYISRIISNAILDYHNQLREKLLESGIDIGKMDMDTINLRKAYHEKINSDV